MSYTFTPASAQSPGGGSTIDPTAAVDLTIGTATNAGVTGNVITGTIGGVAFEQVNLLDVSSLIIDLSGGSIPYASPDSVTLTSGGFVTKDLQNVTILMGNGTNTITIDGASLALPTPVFDVTYQGTDSGDTIGIQGMTNQTVAGGTLQMEVTDSNRPTLQLADPTSGLTVNGGAGEDQVSISSIDGSWVSDPGLFDRRTGGNGFRHPRGKLRSGRRRSFGHRRDDRRRLGGCDRLQGGSTTPEP